MQQVDLKKCLKRFPYLGIIIYTKNETLVFTFKIIKPKQNIHFDDKVVTYLEAFRCRCTKLGDQTLCPN